MTVNMTTRPSMEERLKSHYESLQRAIRFTRTADTKAAPVIALQIALLGVLATRLERLLPIITQGQWDAERVVLIVVAAFYGIATSWSIAIAAWVYVPRHGKAGGSLIYFEDIAAMGGRQFKERAMGMTPEEIEEQLLDQIYLVSRIASDKMRRVRCAFVASVPSGILGIALLGWGSMQPPIG